MKLDDGAQVEIGERVATQHDEGFIRVEQFGGLAHTARCPQRHVFDRIANVQAEFASVAVVVLNVVRHVLHRQHQVGDAVALTEVEDVPQHGFVDEGDHGFWAVDGQWAQTRAFATSHDDGLHGGYPPGIADLFVRVLIVALSVG